MQTNKQTIFNYPHLLSKGRRKVDEKKKDEAKMKKQYAKILDH